MRATSSLAIGLAAGAALALTAPLAASDPPAAKAGHLQGRWSRGDAHQGTESVDQGDAAHHHDATHPPGPELAFRGCAYFENANFAGRRGELRENASAEWVGRAWNDRISSIACHPGCRLIGYLDINYGGQRRNFPGAVADLGADWNDRISALRAVCDAAEAAHHWAEAAVPASPRMSQ